LRRLEEGDGSVVADDEGNGGHLWAVDRGSMAAETVLEMGVVVRSVSGWSGENRENADEMQTLGRND